MRQMTLNAFVKQYLLDLSGQKSLSVHKLAILANKSERIKNALVLYCSLNNKIKILVKYINIGDEEKEELLSGANILEKQYRKYDFEKIYLSYQRYTMTKEYDNKIKATILANTLTLINEKKITKYKVYKTLRLNPGNINDYLTNGNVDKVSLSTSKRIYQFCLSY